MRALLRNFKRLMLAITIGAYTEFMILWRRPLLRLALIACLALLLSFGGVTLWRIATVPPTKTFPQVSFEEFLDHVKEERIAELDIKQTIAGEATQERDPGKLFIFAKLETGEVLITPVTGVSQINYISFPSRIQSGEIKGLIMVYDLETASVSFRRSERTIKEVKVLGWQNTQRVFVSSVPSLLPDAENLATLLAEHGVPYWELPRGTIREGNGLAKFGFIGLFVLACVAFIALIAAAYFMVRLAETEKARKVQRVTFADVAGVDEAKQELMEIRNFLLHPELYASYGARIPKGALLIGSPGCGKTLLARAPIHETGVPYKAIAGSEFGDKFMGEGPKRVRSLFREARQTSRLKNKLFVIFIDEIDAVGTRNDAAVGGESERNQIITQILHEMDGLESNERIFVIAATNRPEILDPAIRRPGRFDREVYLPIPDLRGRAAILEVHLKDKKHILVEDLAQNTGKIAELTPLGFSGADLANVANEVALAAALQRKKQVALADFAKAIEKILAGAERKSAVISDDDKRRTAFHESGHTLVALYTPHASMPEKVSIIPTTKGIGGFTKTSAAEEERPYWTKAQLLAKIQMLHGGRIAEGIAFGADQVSQGASDDFQKATDIADKMIREFVIASEELGPQTFGVVEGNPYLGGTTRRENYSPATAEAIERTKTDMLRACYEQAEQTLQQHRAELDLLAKALQQREELSIEEIRQLISENHL